MLTIRLIRMEFKSRCAVASTAEGNHERYGGTIEECGPVSAPPPAPKFCKQVHHVIRVAWQRKFAAHGMVGPIYKNVLTGKTTGPRGWVARSPRSMRTLT